MAQTGCLELAIGMPRHREMKRREERLEKKMKKTEPKNETYHRCGRCVVAALSERRPFAWKGEGLLGTGDRCARAPGNEASRGEASRGKASAQEELCVSVRVELEEIPGLETRGNKWGNTGLRFR